MAKLEHELRGNFDSILSQLNQNILSGSMTAEIEDGSDVVLNDVRVAVRVYERYSAMGGNRVAMAVTVVGHGDRVLVSGITAGGSEGMFLKLNTFGEEAFLDTLGAAIQQLR